MLVDLNEVPRARQSSINVEVSSSANYELRFIDLEEEIGDPSVFPDADSETSPQTASQTAFGKGTHHTGPRRRPQSPDIQTRWAPKESVKNTTPMGVMLLGGALLWIGVLATLAGSLITVLSFTNNAEELDISVDSGQALVIVGSALFLMGLVFDLFFIKPDKWLEIGILIIGIAGVWVIFFSELILTGLVPSLIGMMFYLAAVVMYFQMQRT
jgi:drug/metabolite transporter (DMT)-like permease